MHNKWKFLEKSHWKWGFSFIGGVVLCTGAVICGGAYWLTGGHPDSFLHFLYTYRMVKENYFRPIDEDALWQGASRGMLSGLDDPYSTLLSGDSYNSFMETTNGE